MKRITKTRIKCQHCDGGTHTVILESDGSVVSSGCGDVTDKAKRIAAMVDLGGSVAEPSCAGLGALVHYGIASIFNKPGAKNGDELPLGGWRSLYMRFESLKVVEATIKRERNAGRLRRRKAAAAAPVVTPGPES